MKQILLIFVLAIATITMPQSVVAQSTCYVDYKAKRSNGGSLQLHYGVIQLGQNACANSTSRAKAVAKRISADGWSLLRVMSTFDDSGLQKRRANAGQFFLRY